MSGFRGGLGWTLAKSLAFVVVTLLSTGVLAVAVAGGSGGLRDEGTGYTAIFSDATSLNPGDDVRMAGVRIGTVRSVEVHDRREAEVGFSIDPEVALASTVTAALRYRNLVGQRYIALEQGDGSPSQRLAPGSTLGLDRTTPALDLTVLFNGFQPLFVALDPKDVNTLAHQIVQVFQGEGGTVESLISQTAALTQTLADKDEVIGQVITNLTEVLDTLNSRTEQLSSVVITLQQLTTGLASDRAALGSAIESIGGLTTSVGGLLEEGRAPLKSSIDSLGQVSGTLADNGPELDEFFQTLPQKYTALGRTASYGSWLNFYLCAVSPQGIPVPDGYYGGVGATAPTARCRA